jgi:hypothetical protein
VFAAIVGSTALAATTLFAAAGSAQTVRDVAVGTHAVFVQTDNVAGNSIVAYDRSVDGTLHPAATNATDGLDGVLDGSVVDHLASQGSLTYDNGLIYAVNAGSDTITAFRVNGDRLSQGQVLPRAPSRSASPPTARSCVLNARDGACTSRHPHRLACEIRSSQTRSSNGMPSRCRPDSPSLR